MPRPHLDLCEAGVLVSDLLDGTTLADSARPKDPGAAARVLVEAFRAAALDAGLAPADPRPSHVVVMADARSACSAPASRGRWTATAPGWRSTPSTR